MTSKRKRCYHYSNSGKFEAIGKEENLRRCLFNIDFAPTSAFITSVVMAMKVLTTLFKGRSSN